MYNMPDDVRMYDLDPRSPFFVEPPEVQEEDGTRCWQCDKTEEDCECSEGYDA